VVLQQVQVAGDAHTNTGILKLGDSCCCREPFNAQQHTIGMRRTMAELLVYACVLTGSYAMVGFRSLNCLDSAKQST
jgi:hypothetical protein